MRRPKMTTGRRESRGRKRGGDGPKFDNNVRDCDDRRDSIRRPPPEAEPFERDIPHWDGRWVGHLYLPSQCDIEDKEEAAVDDLETTNHDNDEDDDNSLQNGGASRDGKGDGGDGSSGSN